MPKTIAVTCQVCLGVNDPADVLNVKIEHAPVGVTVLFVPCRLCTLSIMKAAIQSELIDPSEVFGAELAPPPTAQAASEAPGNGAAVADSSPAAAPDADIGAQGGLQYPADGNGEAAGPMPGGKCALDCGRAALPDDIYCGECRATLRE